MKKPITARAGMVLLASLLALGFLAGCGKTGQAIPTEEEQAAAQAEEPRVEPVQDIPMVGEGLPSCEPAVADVQPAGERPPPAKTPVRNEPVLVEVPDLAGASFEEAAALLGTLGLQVSAAEDYSESVSTGRISSQHPPAGSTTGSGSVVSVLVSLGSAWATCPSCDGAGSAVEEYNCPECGGSGFCDT